MREGRRRSCGGDDRPTSSSCIIATTRLVVLLLLAALDKGSQSLLIRIPDGYHRETTAVST